VVDLGLEIVTGFERGVMAAGHGYALGKEALGGPADIEGAQHVHRVARDPHDLGAELLQDLLEVVGMETKVQETDIMAILPCSRSDIFESDGLGDRSHVSPAYDFFFRVGIDEQDSHLPHLGATGV
jgi:hypothetical protein